MSIDEIVELKNAHLRLGLADFCHKCPDFIPNTDKYSKEKCMHLHILDWKETWGPYCYECKAHPEKQREKLFMTSEERIESRKRCGINPSDVSDLVAQIDKANALALACQDPAERMRYVQMKRALEHGLARASGLKDFGFVPSENNPISGNSAE